MGNVLTGADPLLEELLLEELLLELELLEPELELPEFELLEKVLEGLLYDSPLLRGLYPPLGILELELLDWPPDLKNPAPNLESALLDFMGV